MSTKMGIAPVARTEDAHATQVNPGTSTSSPLETPNASNAIVKAAEPDEVGTQYSILLY